MTDLPQLRPDARTPLYEQLRSWLEDGIRRRVWPPDTLLPSERELGEKLQISRATVRQAVDALEREGWVIRRHGRGTFVAPVEVEQPLAIGGFSENMRRAGVTPSSKLLSAALEEPSAEVAEALGLVHGEVVAVITRLRLADGEPLMVERSHLPYALVPRLLEQDLTGSLYALLTETYRLRLHRGEETLEVVRPERWVTGALGLKKKTSLFYTRRLVTDDQGNPVEFALRYARADRCSFRVTLAGGSADFTIKGAGPPER